MDIHVAPRKGSADRYDYVRGRDESPSSKSRVTDEHLNEPLTVVVDDYGIGVRLRGVLEHCIRWCDIRTIEIEVIDYGGEAEAFWVIDGAHRTPDAPAFFAPVEVVAGGDELTKKLRSRPGFDDAAFQRARAAEERAEAGTFVCWSC